MASSGRSIGNWAVSLVGLGLLALFLILVNYVAGELRLRADLTEENIYTLSDSSRQVLEGITTPVTIRFYYSRSAEDVPVLIKTYAQRVDDLLEEYREIAGDGLIIERIDPKPDTEVEETAYTMGLIPFQLPNGDSFFSGMVVRCLDAEVTLPALMPMGGDNLEYDITRAVHRVINPQKPTLGLMSGITVTGEQGNPMLGGQGGRPPWQFLTLLRETYEVEEVPLTATAIPDHIEHLLVIHPKAITPATEFALDQFILRGGHLVVAVDTFCMADSETNEQMPWMRPQPGASTLPTLFPAWGLSYPLNQAVFDLEYPFTFPNQLGQQQTLGGYVHIDERGNVDSEPTVALLENLLLPLPGAFTITNEEGLTKTPLLLTSNQAARLNPNTDLGQNLAQMPFSQIITKVNQAGTGERMPLALRVQGRFTTAFPQGPPGGATTGDILTESADDTALYLIGDVDLLFDDLWFNQVGFMGQRVPTIVRDNFYLFQNALDALGGTVDMIGLRSRSSVYRPLEKIAEMKRIATEKQQSKVQEVMDELQELQEAIRGIRVVQRGNQLVFDLSEEQLAKLDEYEEQREVKRKELRQLRREQREDVDALQNWWIRFNIVLVPFLIAHFGIILALFRARRKTSQITSTES